MPAGWKIENKQVRLKKMKNLKSRSEFNKLNHQKALSLY